MQKHLLRFSILAVLTSGCHAASFTFKIDVQRSLLDNGTWTPVSFSFYQTWQFEIVESWTGSNGLPPNFGQYMNGSAALSIDAVGTQIRDHIGLGSAPSDSNYLRLYNRFFLPTTSTSYATHYFGVQDFTQIETPLGDGRIKEIVYTNDMWSEGSFPLNLSSRIDLETLAESLVAIGPINWGSWGIASTRGTDGAYTYDARILYEGSAILQSVAVPEPPQYLLFPIGAALLSAMPHVTRNRRAHSEAS